MSAALLHARLPRLAPGAARLRTGLLAALDGLAAGGETFAARFEPAPPEGGWIVCESSPGLVLLRLTSADPLGAAAALGAAEPLILAIERALGIELAPVGSVARLALDAIAIAVGNGRAWLAVAPGVALAPPSRTAPMPPAFSAMRVPLPIRFAALALARADFAALGPGDLLLSCASAAVTLRAGDRTIHARLTAPPLRARIEAVTRSPETSMTLDAPPPAMPPPDAGMGDFPVPVTIALDGVTLPLATIAGLAEGSVIELGRAGASLPVRLMVGEQLVATGELVAVGDAYGVLVKARA